MIRGLVRWFDRRLGAAHFARTALNKVFPDNWSFMLGEIALYCFVVLVVTGTFLAFFFEPSRAHVVYDGAYAPLHGVSMSRAYRSAIQLSFDVRAGLLLRQVHHWAALVFLAAIVAHLSRIFFTGAFRRPRELNWLLGIALLVLALVNGFLGYSLLDDLLSGTGVRIAWSLLLGVPVVGEWLATLVFGGRFPTDVLVERFFVLHVFVVPGLIAAILSAHLGMVWRQKHTQFPGPGRTERNVVGSRLWPTYAAKSVGLLFVVAGVLVALGALVQINPVWLYGPYDPAAATTASQPDWYMGPVEGALRLAGAWRVELFGHTVPSAFLPGVVFPTVTILVLLAWPFLEQAVTHDRAEHHLLDRPRDRPVRTAIGVAALTFHGVLLLAGSQDVVAKTLEVDVGDVRLALRVVVFVLPVLLGVVAWRWASDLRAAGTPSATLTTPPPVGPTDPGEEAVTA